MHLLLEPPLQMISGGQGRSSLPRSSPYRHFGDAAVAGVNDSEPPGASEIMESILFVLTGGCTPRPPADDILWAGLIGVIIAPPDPVPIAILGFATTIGRSPGPRRGRGK